MPEVVGRLRTPRLSAAPSSPASGEVYYDTDDNVLYWWNGAVWISASGAGGSFVEAFERPDDPLTAAEVGDIWIDTDAPTPPSAGRVQLVSALPGSASDGDEVYYQNAAMATDGVLWHLRYRAAASGSYKWEFVGGSSLKSVVEGYDTSVITGVWHDLGVSGPQLTIPLAGDYEEKWGANLRVLSGANQVNMGLSVDGAAPAIGYDIEVLANVSGEGAHASRSKVQTLGAGVLLKARYYVASGQMSARGRWLEIVPVRVG